MKISNILYPVKGLSAPQASALGNRVVNALRLSGWAPVAMITLSVLATIFAAKEAYQLVIHAREVVISTTQSTAVLEKKPLSASEYETLSVSFGRLHPSVKITLREKPAGLVLSIDNAALYADWLHALSVIHAQQPGVFWEVNELCVGRCGSTAATASITGIRQNISITEN